MVVCCAYVFISLVYGLLSSYHKHLRLITTWTTYLAFFLWKMKKKRKNNLWNSIFQGIKVFLVIFWFLKILLGLKIFYFIVKNQFLGTFWIFFVVFIFKVSKNQPCYWNLTYNWFLGAGRSTKISPWVFWNKR